MSKLKVGDRVFVQAVVTDRASDLNGSPRYEGVILEWVPDELLCKQDALAAIAELERERDELRARLAEYEQSPTVATVVSDSNRDDYWYTLDAGKLPPVGTELIARPTRKDGE